MNAVFTDVRAKWLPLYKRFQGMAGERFGQFSEQPAASALLWKRGGTFAEVSARRDCMIVAFAADALHDEWQPAKTLQTSKNRVVHYFEVTEADDRLLADLLDRMAPAFERAARSGEKRPRPQAPAPAAYASVDAYIAAFPAEIGAILQRIRAVIREAAPDAVEKISWQMPTYHQGENLVHFAAQKTHIGFYPSPDGIAAFAERLSGYKTTKGGVQFPLAQPIPYDLIGDITRYRVRAVTAARE